MNSDAMGKKIELEPGTRITSRHFFKIYLNGFEII